MHTRHSACSKPVSLAMLCRARLLYGCHPRIGRHHGWLSGRDRLREDAGTPRAVRLRVVRAKHHIRRREQLVVRIGRHEAVAVRAIHPLRGVAIEFRDGREHGRLVFFRMQRGDDELHAPPACFGASARTSGGNFVKPFSLRRSPRNSTRSGSQKFRAGAAGIRSARNGIGSTSKGKPASVA